MGSSIDTVTAVAEMVFTAVCARPMPAFPETAARLAVLLYSEPVVPPVVVAAWHWDGCSVAVKWNVHHGVCLISKQQGFCMGSCAPHIQKHRSLAPPCPLVKGKLAPVHTNNRALSACRASCLAHDECCHGVVATTAEANPAIVLCRMATQTKPCLVASPHPVTRPCRRKAKPSRARQGTCAYRQLALHQARWAGGDASKCVWGGKRRHQSLGL